MTGKATTQSVDTLPDRLSWLREKAKQDDHLQFNNLLTHIDLELLTRAYYALNRKAAVGIDEVSWRQYGVDLINRLTHLLSQIHTNQYKPKPVKRVWIPKSNGEQRPLGVTSVEDKVVQQAVLWVMEAIYEQDFLGFSHGFRPGRHQHHALDRLYVAISQKKVSWILDADIKGFFDNINHDWLMRFIEHRIADKRLLRILDRWLKCGVMDNGQLSKTAKGTPQGAVISPLLGNIYLHYVLDVWANQWRNKRARGDVFITRYADDSVFCFQYYDDGLRYQRELTTRLSKFGLALNTSKTRLIEFGRFSASNRKERGRSKPKTFEFLGFTHICSTRIGDGKFCLKRVYSSAKLRTKLNAIKVVLRKMLNQDTHLTGKWLRQVVQGFFNYAAVPGNLKSLDAFRSEICRLWHRLLRRRGNKHKNNWIKSRRLIDKFIPSVRILHPYPSVRFSA